MNDMVHFKKCEIRENGHTQPIGASLQFPKGWGLLTVKIKSLKAKYDPNLEFPGGGLQSKNPALEILNTLWKSTRVFKRVH